MKDMLGRNHRCAMMMFMAWVVLSRYAMPVAGGEAPDYHADVVPLLRDYCSGCHNDQDLEGDFSVETFRSLMKGGEEGPAIVPGKAQESLLLKVLTGRSKPRMPPRREPQPSAEQIAVLEKWVNAGAQGPAHGKDVSFLQALSVPAWKPGAGLKPPLTAAAYSKDGRWLALARFGKVEIRETSESGGEPVRVLTGFPGKINALHWAPNGKEIVVATGVTGLNGEASIWSLDQGALTSSFSGSHDDMVFDAELSPDGKILATAGYDRKIVLWRVDDGEALRTIRGHNGAIFDLAFHPGGGVLASASGDETVKLWQVSTGKRLDTLNQPQGEQFSVAFTPDGRLILAGGADNRIRAWQLVSLDRPRINPLLHARFAHEDDIVKLAVSADGQWLVSAAADRTLKTWRLPDLELMQDLGRTTDIVTDLAMIPGARRFTAVQWDGQRNDHSPEMKAGREPDPPGMEFHPVGGSDKPAEYGPVHSVESVAANHGRFTAQVVALPAEIRGTLSKPDESDWFQFAGRKGEEWILSVRAARDQSPLDSKLEVLDSGGNAIEQVVLQAVRDSWFTFRGKDSDTSGDFRLQNWREMELNEYLYANGEVVKLWHYPRGPDSGFLVYPGFGKRRTYFGTSALSHALGEPCYIVQPLSPGAMPRANGLPAFRLYYENDDDPDRRWGTDSKLMFTVPEDGDYLVRISDVRGFGGEDYQYTLNIRPRQPGFKVLVEGQNPSVSPGSGREFVARAEREDGFEGEIRVEVEGLPEGFSTTGPLIIQAGQDQAVGVIYAGKDASPPSGEEGKRSVVRATAVVRGREITRQEGSLGEIKLGPPPKLLVEIRPDGESGRVVAKPGAPLEFTIAPGETITAMVKATRMDFSGRIEFGTDDSSRNLPHGVFIDNIGLNGLLIVEGETERQFFITAAKWVPETTRMFHLRAKADGGQASRPAVLHVRKPAQVVLNP